MLLAAIVALTISPSDSGGRFSVEFSPGPRVIYLGREPLAEDYEIPMPAGTLCDVRTFIGWDHGSIGEASLELNLGGIRLYERSEHKESPANYDAWKSRPVRVTSQGIPLHVRLDGWMTRPNAHDGGLSTRVEFSIRVAMVRGDSCD